MPDTQNLKVSQFTFEQVEAKLQAVKLDQPADHFLNGEGNYVQITATGGTQYDDTDIKNSIGTLTDLTTDEQGSLVGAVNELNTEKADKATDLAGYGITDAYSKTEVDDAIKVVDDKIGDTTTLATTDKDNLVNAVNELFTNKADKTDLNNLATMDEVRNEINQAQLGGIGQVDLSIYQLKSDIGELTDLKTIEQNTVIGAINEIKTLADGKVNTGTTLAEYGIADAYTKTETDSEIQTKIAEAISNVNHLKREIVTQVPSADMANENTVYMFRVGTAKGSDLYQEWMLIDGDVVLIGDTSTDLTDYVKTETLNNHIQDTDIHITTDEKQKWNDKQDAITGVKGQFVGFDDDGKPIATDAQGGGNSIDDNSVSESSLWSSKKVNDELETQKNSIGNLSDLTTTDNTSLVNAINEVSAKSGSSSTDRAFAYTFIVDSDDALTKWALGVAGYNYKSVLVKTGKWTCSFGVDLSKGQTVCVMGEPEAKLVFNDVEKGIYYPTLPEDNDMWTDRAMNTGRYIKNLIVEVNGNTDTVSGFDKCVNVENCYSKTYSGGNTYSAAFNECVNVTNCDGLGGSNYAEGIGFNNCTMINNCAGVGTSGSTGYGFKGCKGVTHCKEKVGQNGETCTTAVFEQSYASLVEDEKFLCNGTSTGGFNGEEIPQDASGGNANGGGSGGGTTGIFPQFTYVVDSDQALQDWADNVAGNDYTSVLIKKGTWTISGKGVYLTLTNTKSVYGEPDSNLVFSESNVGLYYADTDAMSLKSNPDRWMFGVNLTLNNTNPDKLSSYAFMRCVNLTNCTSTLNVPVQSGGYFSCTNLSNCVSRITMTLPDSVTSRQQSAFCFRQCINLTNCIGYGEATNAKAGICCFQECVNLTNCRGFSSGHYINNTYSQCQNLSSCYGESTCDVGDDGDKNTWAQVYSICKNLTNCTGIATTPTDSNVAVGRGWVFRSCAHVVNCGGKGIGTHGLAFQECKSVRGCRATGTCGYSTPFLSSYASSTADATYACADTPEGGFNIITNPTGDWNLGDIP